ncbi:MAG: hypothetical protein CMJ72_02975 [Planctomycetaceae bacterium]|nr:hypothetical protein [Planctomycetaceae bacterium]
MPILNWYFGVVFRDRIRRTAFDSAEVPNPNAKPFLSGSFSTSRLTPNSFEIQEFCQRLRSFVTAFFDQAVDPGLLLRVAVEWTQNDLAPSGFAATECGIHIKLARKA